MSNLLLTSKNMNWAGQLPDHWERKKAKFVFKERSEKGNAVNLQLLSPTQKYGVIPQTMYDELSGMRAVKLKEDTDLSLLKTIHPNDFCISLRSFQGGFEMSKYEGVVSPAYHVFFATDKIIPRYYKYLFKDGNFVSRMNYNAQSLRDGKPIPFSDFSNVYIPIPPIEEQGAISSYLDSRCARIDEAIERHKKIIEKLEEYKKSAINKAVTKGIRSDCKMKDSGIAWIGEIPETWKLERLRFSINEYKSGPFGSALITDKLLPEGHILVYTPEHVTQQSDKISSDLFLPQMRADEMSQFFVKPGDIVFPIVGSLGKAMLIQKNMRTGIINQRLAKFSINPQKIAAEYFIWLFAKCLYTQAYLDSISHGTAIVNITKVDLMNMPIPIPPLPEQQSIIHYLNNICADIVDAIERENCLIKKLEEYRKSIIYHAVTGKIDCRKDEQ